MEHLPPGSDKPRKMPRTSFHSEKGTVLDATTIILQLTGDAATVPDSSTTPIAPMDVDSVIASDEGRRKLMSQNIRGSISGKTGSSSSSSSSANQSSSGGEELQTQADKATVMSIDKWTMMELKLHDALGEACVQAAQWHDAKQCCTRYARHFSIIQSLSTLTLAEFDIHCMVC
jgi:hypothetical protein